jgi:hypothetical protein
VLKARTPLSQGGDIGSTPFGRISRAVLGHRHVAIRLHFSVVSSNGGNKKGMSCLSRDISVQLNAYIFMTNRPTSSGT